MSGALVAAVGRQAMAVEQHQGGVATEAAQIDAGGVGGVLVADIGGPRAREDAPDSGPPGKFSGRLRTRSPTWE